jgi:signal transduction histidine kinase
LSDAVVARRSRGVGQVAFDIASSIRSALGCDDTSVTVVLPDGAGRLRVVAEVGASIVRGRRRSSRRRLVYRTGHDLALRLGEGVQSLSILPLRTGSETIGVLEIVAPADEVDRRREPLLAMVKQSATLMKVSHEREEAARSVRGMERLLAMAAGLNGASGPVAAMEIVAEACSAQVAGPAVVARPDRTGAGWFLAAAAGIGGRKRAALRSALHLVPLTASAEEQLAAVERTFEKCLGVPASARPAARAVLVSSGEPDEAAYLDTAATMLARTLDRLTGHRAQTNDVGLGMAWTAHELRAPLVGARAALEHLIESGGSPDADLLVRTKVELDGLAALVDPLLRWSAGRADLRFEECDLRALVRDAIASATFAGGADRVRLVADEEIRVAVDPDQLRTAIANVVRNGLLYAPDGSPVLVEVFTEGSVAKIRVRDRGPGIPPEERAGIFDALVRGGVAVNVRNGTGLGLFIARRVAEGHHGALLLEPTRSGASFCFALPAGGERRRASAS